MGAPEVVGALALVVLFGILAAVRQRRLDRTGGRPLLTAFAVVDPRPRRIALAALVGALALGAWVVFSPTPSRWALVAASLGPAVCWLSSLIFRRWGAFR